MSETRHANREWNLGEIVGAPKWNQIECAVLMDIRNELRKISAVLECPNFRRIPAAIDRISEQKEKRRAAVHMRQRALTQRKVK